MSRSTLHSSVKTCPATWTTWCSCRRWRWQRWARRKSERESCSSSWSWSWSSMSCSLKHDQHYKPWPNILLSNCTLAIFVVQVLYYPLGSQIGTRSRPWSPSSTWSTFWSLLSGCSLFVGCGWKCQVKWGLDRLHIDWNVNIQRTNER